MRAYVYVDGFNLYYRALKGTPHKWLNLSALATQLLDPGDTLERIRYFTARVSARGGSPNAPRDQQVYLSALSTIPNITCQYGRFLTKTKTRPLADPPHSYVTVNDTEEKGSDVNLASHLINDGWNNKYDVALVLSQDTDLIEPMRIVKYELKKLVGLVWLDGKQPSRYMEGVSSFVRHATPARLAASQFTNPLPRPNAPELIKPPGW